MGSCLGQLLKGDKRKKQSLNRVIPQVMQPSNGVSAQFF